MDTLELDKIGDEGAKLVNERDSVVQQVITTYLHPVPSSEPIKERKDRETAIISTRILRLCALVCVKISALIEVRTARTNIVSKAPKQ